MLSDELKFKAFPKIQAPKGAKKQLGRVRIPTKDLTFTGTVKLHGSNGCVAKTQDGVHCQSRNRLLSLVSDSYQFAYQMGKIDWDSYLKVGEYVYGEWAGEGIQKGVAISTIPKTFYVFAVATYDEDGVRTWHTTDELISREFPDGVECIPKLYPPKYVKGPFTEESASHINALTLEVEESCPVSMAVADKVGVGEGLVWRCEDDGLQSSRFWFKTKGDKHQSGAKVRTVKSNRDYGPATELATPFFEARAHQGLEYVREMFGEPDRSNTGDYVKWVIKDIFEEEEITEPPDLVKKAIGKMAAGWYLENY